MECVEGRTSNGIEQIFEGINKDLASLTASGHLADSEGDNGDEEQEEEEDSCGEDPLNPPPPGLFSFRRAPAMGGRALDHRLKQETEKTRSSSRSRTVAPSQQQDSSGSERSVRKTRGERDRSRVGQLDEKNIKRAVHRYGTLPKGARIGAYLESLRVMTPEPVSDESGHDTLDSHKSGHTDPGKSVSPPTPAMARSNSSHGGFPGASSHKSRQSNNLPRRLPTYTQAAPNSPITRSRPSALPELDFPPPPMDLPPSPRQTPPPATPSPRPRLPKVRAHSSDSCDSAPSYSDNTSLRLGCVSPLQLPTASPANQLIQEMAAASTKPRPRSISPRPPSHPPPQPKAPASAGPAAQLVTELFESLKAKSEPELTPQITPDLKAGLRPVARSLLEPKSDPSPPPDFKSQLKKVNNDTSLMSEPTSLDSPDGNFVDFKSALRPVNSSSKHQLHQMSESQEETNKDKISLRTSLRPVSGDDIDKCHDKLGDKFKLKSNYKTSNTSAVNANANVNGEAKEENQDPDEDKRKSTGSISSLVKMWEAGDDKSTPQSEELSPVPAEERPASVVKFEKRVWPPVPSTETEKPMVPVKPTVKPPPTSKPPPPKEPAFKPKPLTTAKPPVCNIYAAPSSVSPRGNKPNISLSKPRMLPSSRLVPAGDAGASVEDKEEETEAVVGCDRESLVRSSRKLEESLNSLGKGEVTTATAMTVSQQAGSFQSCCSSYVDSIPATGRFRFRSLLAKLDNQAKELRAVNTGKKSQNTQLVKDIQVTVKDLVSVIQR